MLTKWFYPAFVIDVGAFFSPLAMSSQPAALLALLGLHGMASALLALALLPMLPKNYRQQKIAALALLFLLGFMAPAVGPIVVASMLRLTFPKNGEETRTSQTIEIPEFDPGAKDVERAAQGAVRSRLGKHVPEALRLQSLLTLQAVPNAVANPILEGLLADDTDDIRLVAFGMLNAKEKDLSARIQRERERLDEASNELQRYQATRNLADLHWELIYACLAQGELRQYILETAWSYVERARQFPQAANDAPLAMLAGRILMMRGRLAEAQSAFELSFVLGQPTASVLPYLAELAYLRRDHASVRSLMNALSSLQLAPRVRALVDFWTGHSSPRTFLDRRILPHL